MIIIKRTLMIIMVCVLVPYFVSFADATDNPEAETALKKNITETQEPEGILVEGQLNINTATADQFAMLPSIDRFEAAHIIDYRNANEKFNAIDDLLKVKGIYRLEYKKFKDFLTLEGETTIKQKIKLY